MGWTDNREQGLTGRKRPCAPRSSQLQTSITMIIYPALAKCTGSVFHQRPVNRHCIGKFMGTGSQGQVGKPASHWHSPAKEERSLGRKKSALCSVERTIYYWVFAEDSTCCLRLIFSLSSLASDACLNKVWKCVYQSPLAGAHLAQSPEILGSSGGHESSSEEGAMPLSLATSIRKRARGTVSGSEKLDFGRNDAARGKLHHLTAVGSTCAMLCISRGDL